MKRTIVWVVLVGAAAVAGSAVLAGNPHDGDAGKQMKELKKKHTQLRTDIAAIQKKMNLHEDPEVIKLTKAFKEAKRALEAKLREKTITDPKGAAAYDKLDEVTKQIRQSRRMSKQKGRRTKSKKEKAAGDAPPPEL